MQNIYLVGFMATGKTSVGKLLAQKLKKEFLDLDDLIEQRENTRIVDIFFQKGEPYFRKIECEAIKEVSIKQDLVVSCGGGAIVNPENLENFKKSGKVFCLKASVDAILRRNKGDKRPLLNVDNPQQRIKDLLEKREPFYNQADYCIDTSRLTVEKVVEEIIDVLGKEPI